MLFEIAAVALLDGGQEPARTEQLRRYTWPQKPREVAPRHIEGNHHSNARARARQDLAKRIAILRLRRGHVECTTTAATDVRQHGHRKGPQRQALRYNTHAKFKSRLETTELARASHWFQFRHRRDVQEVILSFRVEAPCEVFQKNAPRAKVRYAPFQNAQRPY